ncbi:MAG: UrcA family protein [Pseudomonadota bacterium]
MSLSKSLTTILGSALALSMLPAFAGATTDTHAKTMEISIAGYDLSNPDDAKLVYGKIQTAAKRVCKTTTARQTLRERADEMRCRADAVAKAIVELDEPVLTFVMNQNSSSS